MNVEDVISRAKAQAATMSRPADVDGARDRLRAELAGFFERLPEPPVYRRRDDPSRAAAAKHLAEGEVLLTQLWLLDTPSLARWREALEAHLLTQSLLLEGRIEAAEDAWRLAVDHERDAVREKRAWERTDEQPEPVYQRADDRSRFDPRPDPSMQVKLMCPECRAVGGYAFSLRRATHQLTCRSCQTEFWAYIAELRAVELKQLNRNRRRYSMRLEELTGGFTRIDFDDSSGAAFSSARRDLLAFLYLPRRTLRGVLDLSSSRVLWLQPAGPCFLATAVFGENAPELDAFRDFRDRRLLPHAFGRAAVRTYYALGPALAAVVRGSPLLHRTVKSVLQRVYEALV